MIVHTRLEKPKKQSLTNKKFKYEVEISDYNKWISDIDKLNLKITFDSLMKTLHEPVYKNYKYASEAFYMTHSLVQLLIMFTDNLSISKDHSLILWSSPDLKIDNK